MTANSTPGVTRSAPAVTALAVTAVAVLAVLAVLSLTVGLSDDADNLTQLIFAGSATAAAATTVHRTTGRLRRAWWVLTVGTGSWTLGQLVLAVHEIVLDRAVEELSVADLGFFGFGACAIVALWIYPAYDGQGVRTRRLLDGIAAVSALVSISWSLTLGPILSGSGPADLATVVSAAYPVADILMVALAALSVSRPTPYRCGLVLLAAGLSAMAVADSAYAYRSLSDDHREVTTLDLGWPLALLLIGLAALVAGRSSEPVGADGQRRSDRITSATVVLPYLPILVAAAVMLVRFLDGHTLSRVEVLSFIVAVVAVIVRQGLTMGENRRLLDIVAARERQLERQAFHDALTGLANRALFTDRVAHALELHRRDMRPLALLFCDLDDFKAVNDTLGHGAGDELLVRVSERLRGTLRAGDTLARLGGDEFAVLIEDGGESGLVGVRIIETLRTPFAIAGAELSVRASVGLIEIAADEPSPPLASLLAKADVAMYAAKRAGKGQLARWQPDMVLPETQDLELREPLLVAVAGGNVQLAYQPILDLQSGAVVEMEGLARWLHAGLEVPPGRFVPVAERAGIIRELTDLLLDRACVDLGGWAGPPGIRVAVNVAPAVLLDESFPDRLAVILAHRGVEPDRLVLEITEDALVQDPVRAAAVATRLRALGVGLSLDDFGTGSSSVLHLRQIPLTGLKIDNKLIADIDRDPIAERFVHALLTLGSDLGLQVTAEGVERSGQAEVLKRLGCTRGQGFLFAEPLRPADAGLLLARPGDIAERERG